MHDHRLSAFSPAALALGVATALLLAPVSAQGNSDRVIRLSATAGAVRFEQIDFRYENAAAHATDWGQVVVDPTMLRQQTRQAGGYVNFFTPGSGRNWHWIIENLSVPSRATAPIARSFDLRPETQGRGRVAIIGVIILFSVEPLPTARGVLNAVASIPPQTALVATTIVNAEGSQNEAPRTSTTTLQERSATFVLGQPPRPTLPPLQPMFTAHIGVFQDDGPNVEQAKNQCVPAAYANVLQYLEDRYRFTHNWTLAHDPVSGFGLDSFCFSPVEPRFWIPLPSNSLVANLCALSRRELVCNCSVGSGTGSSGFFRYLAAFGQNAPVELKHQGGSAEEVVIDGIKSTRVGTAPTWQWIYEELDKGHGVYMSYCRYDEMGARSGGHAVRVWGAEAYNGKFYLHVIDDGNQGCNASGARSRQIECADIGRPGGGPPNGILNLNGLESRELTGVRSVRPLHNGPPIIFGR